MKLTKKQNITHKHTLFDMCTRLVSESNKNIVRTQRLIDESKILLKQFQNINLSEEKI